MIMLLEDGDLHFNSDLAFLRISWLILEAFPAPVKSSPTPSGDSLSDGGIKLSKISLIQALLYKSDWGLSNLWGESHSLTYPLADSITQKKM